MTSSDPADVTTRPNAPLPVRQGSVRRKLVSFVAALVVLTTLALTVGAYVFVQQLLLEEIRDWLTLDAANRAEMLQSFIQQQHERVALVASRTRLRQLLQLYQDDELPLITFQEQSRRILNDARASTGGFLAIWITNPQGQVITSTRQEYLQEDYAHESLLPQSRQDKNLGLPQPRLGGYEALLTAPAVADNGRELGVIVVLLDVEPMRRFLTMTSRGYHSDEILVGTRQDERIHYLFPVGTVTRIHHVDLSDDPAMAAALTGHKGFLTTHDYRGRQVLAAYQAVGYKDWGLVAKLTGTKLAPRLPSYGASPC